MNTPPPTPTTDPLAHPGVIRIVIEPGQAVPFPSIDECFVSAGPGSCDAHGRTVVWMVPCPRDRLHDAQRVVVGTHKAVRIKPKGD